VSEFPPLKVLPKPIPTSEIMLGDFSFFQMDDGSAWLENKDGEGIQLKSNERPLLDLEECLYEFWRDTF
jgi:hypothetical protein